MTDVSFRQQGQAAVASTTGVVPLRERQRQERERLILRAAEELFLEQGYHDTSIDEIAARVGIAKGTVYLHFASKEDLTLALCEHSICGFVDALDAILSSDGTPRRKLEAVIEHAYGSMSDRNFLLLSSVFRNPEVMVQLHEKKQLLGELWQKPARRLTELFEEGKAAGEFDATIPTPVMLNLLWSLIWPQRFHHLLERDQMPPGEVAQHVIRFFFNGIAGSATRDSGDVDVPTTT